MTSIAHHQGIEPLLIMRYVLWACSQKANPTIHAQYIAYNLAQLAQVPYMILHGYTLDGPNPMNRLFSESFEMLDVNANSIKHAMYGGRKKKSSKKKK